MPTHWRCVLVQYSQWQSRVVATGTTRPVRRKLLMIWSFSEQVCQTLSRVEKLHHLQWVGVLGGQFMATTYFLTQRAWDDLSSRGLGWGYRHGRVSCPSSVLFQWDWFILKLNYSLVRTSSRSQLISCFPFGLKKNEYLIQVRKSTLILIPSMLTTPSTFVAFKENKAGAWSWITMWK